MNEFQKAVCRTYGGGDYAYLIDSAAWEAALKVCGDTLFAFMMRELGDDPDEPMTADVAYDRMQTAAGDIEEAMNQLALLTHKKEDA